MHNGEKVEFISKSYGGTTGNEAVAEMRKNHSAALMNSSKKCTIDIFVKQNINWHENFEGIDGLMCYSYKMKSLFHKLPLNRATGKHGIFAEHSFYTDSSASNYLNIVSSFVHLMHGKIP